MKIVTTALAILVIALAVLAADRPETKAEGRTFAQFPLAKRAAEVNLFMTTNTVQTLLGKPTIDAKGQWTYSEDQGNQQTKVTIRFAGNGKTVVKVSIEKNLSEAYWLHEPDGP